MLEAAMAAGVITQEEADLFEHVHAVLTEQYGVGNMAMQGMGMQGRGMMALVASAPSCWQTIQDYGLRSLGIGERLTLRRGFVADLVHAVTFDNPLRSRVALRRSMSATASLSRPNASGSIVSASE